MDIKSWPTIKGKDDELVTSLQFAVYTRAFAAANKISESERVKIINQSQPFSKFYRNQYKSIIYF